MSKLTWLVCHKGPTPSIAIAKISGPISPVARLLAMPCQVLLAWPHGCQAIQVQHWAAPLSTYLVLHVPDYDSWRQLSE